jgi:hypothetical protein
MVRVEIGLQLQQSAVMSRSGFEASLRLVNGSGSPLTALSVTLNIRDAGRQPAGDRFGVRGPELIGLSAVDGSGVLVAGATGSAAWTLIPATNAAPNGAAGYTIGGEVVYVQDGQLLRFPLFAVPITVLPDPRLEVDYFWEKIVYSDDPFTAETEPSVPFGLGLRMKNAGLGTAKAVQITSGQPQIVENDQGLLIAFNLIGAQVGNQPVTPALEVNLGDIAPSNSAVATWWMTSTLQGQFIEYDASFEHVDDLGNQNLSLVDRVAIHEMVHVARADVPADDNVPDFLVNDDRDPNNLADTLYLSDSSVAPVTAVTNASVTGTVGGGLTLSGVWPAGWVYLRLNDPSQGAATLGHVRRANGTDVRLGDNAWTTHRIIRLPNTVAYREDFIHILDYNPSGSYSVTYGGVAVAPAITSQPQSRTNQAGTAAQFSVVATGTAPLSYQWRKDGTNLLNGGEVVGVYSNTLTLVNVQIGDAGNYDVVVNNSAGSVTSAVARLVVTLPGITLAEAVDAPGLTWSTGGNSVWLGQATVTHDGTDAAQSGIVGNGQLSWIETSVTGPGTLSFWWRVSSEPAFDYLAFLIDGVPQGSTLSGESGWQQRTVSVAVGTHALRWAYGKDDLGAEGQDRAWLDQVSWTPSVAGPAITAQPQSKTNLAGSTVSFGVTATGAAPLSYQWRKNGLPLTNGGNVSGALSNLLGLASVQASDEANYTVVVSNAGGSVTSAVARLTVWVPPTFTTQPQGQTAVQGTNVTLCVSVSGTAPFSYQWWRNGLVLSGATTNCLTITNAQPSDSAAYNVVASNVAGSVTSAVAALTVWVAPSISAQPQSQTNIAGTAANFSVTAAGTGPLAYQWRFNGTNLAGATASSYILANAQPTNAGSYSVVVTNVAGSITSAVASLTVWVPVAITSQPQSQTVVQGTNVTFCVGASGTPPLLYQWRRGGTNLSGATSSCLAFTNIQPSHTAGYTVVVTNVAGSVTSAVAMLTVLVPPAITAQPQSQTNIAGTVANFSVTGTGTVPLAYQWRFNGTNLAGATASSYSVASAQPSNAGSYAVVITNVAGRATSAVAALTVWVPVAITAQPQSRTVLEGAGVAFSVGATGTAPLTYQWSFNGLALASKTNSSLALTGVQTNQAGSYRVLVSNAAGATNSAVATLAVQYYRDTVFANTNLIRIRDYTTAAPYPSAITVSGVGGTLTKVTATLARLSHTWPGDIDALVVGPWGQKALLMSDAGGAATSDLTLPFDDAAAEWLPESDWLIAGTFKPTDYAGYEPTNDVFAARPPPVLTSPRSPTSSGVCPTVRGPCLCEMTAARTWARLPTAGVWACAL